MHSILREIVTLISFCVIIEMTDEIIKASKFRETYYAQLRHANEIAPRALGIATHGVAKRRR